MTQTPPSVIVAGLGTLTRAEIYDLLAIFRDAGLINLARDRFADIAHAIVARGGAEAKEAAFKQRLDATSAALSSSGDPDGLLRLRLWASLRDTFDAPPIIPRSARAATPAASHGAEALAGALFPKKAAVAPPTPTQRRRWRARQSAISSIRRPRSIP